MKLRLLYSFLALIILIQFSSCTEDSEDEPLPLVNLTSVSISGITESSAVANVSISSGEESIESFGFCYSTSPSPTIQDNVVPGSISGANSFSGSLFGLEADTQYFVRAFATNSTGTAYSSERSFSTVLGITLASLMTDFSTSNVTPYGLSFIGASVTNDGGASITEIGFVWSQNSQPTINDNVTPGENATDTSNGIEFNASIEEMNPETTYFIRSYAVNSVGVAYGEEYSFTTEPIPNNALYFDGIDDYVELDGLETGNSFTIELWVNPRDLNNKNFVGKHDNSGGNLFLFGFYGNALHVRVGSDSYELQNAIFQARHRENGSNFLAVAGASVGLPALIIGGGEAISIMPGLYSNGASLISQAYWKIGAGYNFTNLALNEVIYTTTLYATPLLGRTKFGRQLTMDAIALTEIHGLDITKTTLYLWGTYNKAKKFFD